jgi:hypothetical protein
MKYLIMAGVIAATILLVGCGKKNSSSESSATLSSLPALQPALKAWLSGDKSTAITDFLALDWSARPLFEVGSPLSRSDDQMHAVRARSEADYHTESYAITTQLAYLKQLAALVRDAGFDAVSKGDAAQAQKYFTSLKQFGTALDRPDYTLIVQFTGRAYEQYADTGMQKIRK